MVDKMAANLAKRYRIQRGRPRTRMRHIDPLLIYCAYIGALRHDARQSSQVRETGRCFTDYSREYSIKTNNGEVIILSVTPYGFDLYRGATPVRYEIKSQ